MAKSLCGQKERLDDAVVIGEKEGGLYKLKGQLEQAVVHDLVEPNQIWHRRLAHVHYRALPLVRKFVEVFGCTRYSQKTEDLQQPLHTNRSQINTLMFVTWLKLSRGKQSRAQPNSYLEQFIMQKKESHMSFS